MEAWPGRGHWLQISGFAFTHDPTKPKGHRVDAIQLIEDGKLKELPHRPLQVLTYQYLVDGGDGYDMLKPLEGALVGRGLKEHLRRVLEARAEPIRPQVDGRICNLHEFNNRPCAFNLDLVR